MEELDVTSAWILSNFITISTMTMNMKWTCPEKTISLPPSQAITPLFPTRTVVKIRHSHSMIIFFFFWAHHFPSAPGQFLRVLVIFRVETGVGHLVEQPWTVEGGGFGVPLWFGKEGCQDWWDSPLPQTKTQTQTQTHTHTHTQNWKVASSGMSKQTVRSDYEHQKHFSLLDAYPACWDLREGFGLRIKSAFPSGLHAPEKCG